MNSSSSLTSEEHFKLFAEFAKKEVAAGGPDPQLPIMSYLARELNEREKIWMAGCYAATHCVPTAEALFSSWEIETIRLTSIPEVAEWLKERWSGIAFRPERKSVFIPLHMARCMKSFAEWAGYSRPQGTGREVYDALWKDSNNDLRYIGRYMSIKFLELLRQMGVVQAALYDLRANGAWSPRITLALIMGAGYEWLRAKDESPVTLKMVEEVAEKVRLRVAEKIVLSPFAFQVLLCEYREMLAGGFYVGCSHDEELRYARKVESLFPRGKWMNARATLFAPQHLGELQCWDDIRKPLWKNFAKNQYIWSDIEYDYGATKDFINPARRHKESK